MKTKAAQLWGEGEDEREQKMNTTVNLMDANRWRNTSVDLVYVLVGTLGVYG